VRKIDAFAHILPPSYARRVESIMSGGAVSERMITHHAGAMVPHFAGRLASPLEDPGRAAIFGGNAERVLRIPA
jgi:hypothetical protein